MCETIILSILAIGFVLMFINAMFEVYDYEAEYFFPTTLYKNTSMNKAGCVVCSILLFISNYLFCSVILIVYILKKLKITTFVYWLFTTGRKE